MINLNRTIITIIAAAAVSTISGWVANKLSYKLISSNASTDDSSDDVETYGKRREKVKDIRKRIQKQRDAIPDTDTIGIVHLALYNINQELIDIKVMRSVKFLSADQDIDRDRAANLQQSFPEFLDTQAETMIDICNRELKLMEKFSDSDIRWKH